MSKCMSKACKKFHVKRKGFKFGTKNTLFRNFFDWDFAKTIAIFESSIFEFFKLQSFIQNKNTSKLRPKLLLYSVQMQESRVEENS